MKNKYELKSISNYKKRGYEVLTNGYPDFVVFKTKNGKIKKGSIIFIEVKFQYNKLNKQQKIIKEILELLGAKYNIERYKVRGYPKKRRLLFGCKKCKKYTSTTNPKIKMEGICKSCREKVRR